MPNPKSADVYVHKKAKIPPLKQPSYGLHSNISDNEDASTRVSSKSQAQRNYVYQKQNVNLDYLNPVVQEIQTPRPNIGSSRLDHARKIECNYDVQQYVAGGQLPHIKPNARLMSVDLDRMDRESKLNGYNGPS